MSKQMCERELSEHCNNAIGVLAKTLSDFRVSSVDNIRKRAMLIAYWLNTYSRYLRNEDTFDSRSVYRLKRGSIVRVEFGYRVGRELGGRHYAVVIDQENSIYRNTVTVIPLGSLKESSQSDRYSIKLKDGIYGPIKAKLNALLTEVAAIVEDAGDMEASIKGVSPEEAKSLRAVQRTKIESAKRLSEQARAWLEEIAHMQQGTIANVDQITTISKMRISQPLQKTHPLYGVRLTPRDMDEIDAHMEDLYFPNNRKA